MKSATHGSKRYAVLPAALVVPPFSDAAVRLCAYFWMLSREDGTLEVLQPILQREMGWGRRKTLDAIKELVQSGVISVRRTRGASVYRLSWFDDASKSESGVVSATSSEADVITPAISALTREVKALSLQVNAMSKRLEALDAQRTGAEAPVSAAAAKAPARSVTRGRGKKVAEVGLNAAS
jgi:hypothetical protein